MVKSDMTGNASHIRKHVAAAPPGVTLQALVLKDVQAGVAGKDGTAAMSLLWLKRYGCHRGQPVRRARGTKRASERASERPLWPLTWLRARRPRVHRDSPPVARLRL
jgi:hypothetical protein